MADAPAATNLSRRLQAGASSYQGLHFLRVPRAASIPERRAALASLHTGRQSHTHTHTPIHKGLDVNRHWGGTRAHSRLNLQRPENATGAAVQRIIVLHA